MPPENRPRLLRAWLIRVVPKDLPGPSLDSVVVLLAIFLLMLVLGVGFSMTVKTLTAHQARVSHQHSIDLQRLQSLLEHMQQGCPR